MPQEHRDARPRCQYRRGRAKTGLLCFPGIERGSVVEEFCEFVLSRGLRIENEDGVGVEKDFRALPGIGGICGALPVLEFEIR
ncbi:MAG: hypothetical protein ACI9R3_005374 [Verrucomicrobiales bacterium]|jgi:hypothetical protein